jgi:hypothetical protein
MVLTDTAKKAELQQKVTAGILRDTFVQGDSHLTSDDGLTYADISSGFL